MLYKEVLCGITQKIMNYTSQIMSQKP